MSEIRISDILEVLHAKNMPFRYNGTQDLTVCRPVSIDDLADGCISFLRGSNLEPYRRLLTGKKLVIVGEDVSADNYPENNLIFVKSPEIAFYAILALFVPALEPKIHPSAVIESQAKIGIRVGIGALTYIGPHVDIADDTIISEGCVINNTSIGFSTVIQAGVKLGSEALGGLKDDAGRWHDRPHVGMVSVGSHVRIEDNVVINRGYLRDTVIRDNVRIGPQTAIGNAVFIDEGVIIAQCVTIAGSVSIGRNASVWGNSSVREGVALGRNSVVGMGSVVLQNVPAFQLWVGNPAQFKRHL